jgi:hypothetical protein
MKSKQKTNSAPTGRDGDKLNWLVVNLDGKLLAILDSESEAYWFTRNRGHASGAVFFKSPCDYAAAPTLLDECKRLLSLLDLAKRPGEITQTPEGIAQLRAAVALAEGAKPKYVLCEPENH